MSRVSKARLTILRMILGAPVRVASCETNKTRGRVVSVSPSSLLRPKILSCGICYVRRGRDLKRDTSKLLRHPKDHWLTTASIAYYSLGSKSAEDSFLHENSQIDTIDRQVKRPLQRRNRELNFSILKLRRMSFLRGLRKQELEMLRGRPRIGHIVVTYDFPVFHHDNSIRQR